MGKQALVKFSIFILSAFFVSCGGNSDISKVDFSTVPENPIVITGPTKVGDKKVDANWFSLRIKAKNASKKTVTLVAIKHVARVTSDYGVEIKTEFYGIPADFNFSYTVGDTSCSYEFNAFDPIPPNTSETFITVSGAEKSGTAGCIATFQSDPLVFYLGGNPTLEKDGVSSFAYSVDLVPLGWFGTYDEPEDRFEKTEFYQTQ